MNIEEEDNLTTVKEEKEETLTDSQSKEPTFKCGKPAVTEETHSAHKKDTDTNMNFATPSPRQKKYKNLQL